MEAYKSAFGGCLNTQLGSWRRSLAYFQKECNPRRVLMLTVLFHLRRGCTYISAVSHSAVVFALAGRALIVLIKYEISLM